MVFERYFTFIFFPFLMLLPFSPLSFLSFLTVVWFRAAISDNVSPPLIVTDLLAGFFLLLLRGDLRLSAFPLLLPRLLCEQDADVLLPEQLGVSDRKSVV